MCEEKAFVADKDDSGNMSFGEFLEQISQYEANPDWKDIKFISSTFSSKRKSWLMNSIKERALDGVLQVEVKFGKW